MGSIVTIFYPTIVPIPILIPVMILIPIMILIQILIPIMILILIMIRVVILIMILIKMDLIPVKTIVMVNDRVKERVKQKLLLPNMYPKNPKRKDFWASVKLWNESCWLAICLYLQIVPRQQEPPPSVLHSLRLNCMDHPGHIAGYCLNKSATLPH